MEKRIVKVMPDYQSTALWDAKGVEISIDEVSYAVPKECLIALKYWNHVWELITIHGGKFGERYYLEWYHDGKHLVEAMNKLQGAFEFKFYAETPQEMFK